MGENRFRKHIYSLQKVGDLTVSYRRVENLRKRIIIVGLARDVLYCTESEITNMVFLILIYPNPLNSKHKQQTDESSATSRKTMRRAKKVNEMKKERY